MDGHWQPASAPPIDPATTASAVVDELEEDTVLVAVAEWPRVDEKGRLRFPGRTVPVELPRGPLEAFLARHRVPEALRDRPLRIGDAFAVRLRGGRLPERRGGADVDFSDPEAWVEPPVLDLTPEARGHAKASFYAAVAPTLDREEAARLDLLPPGETA